MKDLEVLNETTARFERVPYAQAQKLDPLRADRFMQALPELTSAKQIPEILAELDRIVRQFDKHIFHSVAHSFAALRDLDFLITSAHKIVPGSYKCIPGLEKLLVDLGRSTNHSPRGCNFTYGLFNPQDDRMRTFTGLQEERTFIRAIQEGTKGLDESLLTLFQISVSPLDSAEFEQSVDDLVAQFEAMIPAAVDVLRSVSPEVFSLQIVEFFVPLEINGRNYPGITGAQIQNVAIDFIIYGLDLRDPRYTDYVQANMTAMLSFHDAVINKTVRQLEGVSLLSRIERGIMGHRVVDPSQAIKSLQSLRFYLRRIVSFRQVHRKLAVRNLPLRDHGRGSGGYSLDFLDYLLGKTQEAIGRIQMLIQYLT